MCVSYFCIRSASLCLLVAFNMFTFKAIIDMYATISIFLIVLGLVLQAFFLPFFCSLLLWFDDHFSCCHFYKFLPSLKILILSLFHHQLALFQDLWNFPNSKKEKPNFWLQVCFTRFRSSWVAGRKPLALARRNSRTFCYFCQSCKAARQSRAESHTWAGWWSSR